MALIPGISPETLEKLARNAKTPQEALLYLKKQADMINEEVERKMTAKLIDYYSGTQTRHMEKVIRKRHPKTCEQVLQSLEITNITKPITNQLSVIYNEDPIREIYIQGQEEKSEADQDLFDWIAENGMLNTRADMLNRLETLTGTMNMRFWIDIEDGTMQFEPVDRTRLFAIPSDTCRSKAQGIYHMEEGRDERGAAFQIVHFWTRETYTKYKTYPMSNTVIILEESPNEYGIIPFVRVDTSILQDDYFSDVNEDLVNCQEMVNDTLTGLNNIMRFQSYSIPVFSGWDDTSSPEVGAGVPIALPTRDVNEKPTDFKFETPNPKIEQVSKEITEKMARFARSRGLPENTFSMSSSSVSGVSLYLQHEAIRKHFKRCKTFYEDMEVQLFQVVKAVWNYTEQFLDRDHPMKNKKFNEKAYMRCRIIETQAQKTPEQQITEWEFRLENRLATPIDYYIEHLGMSQAEAEEKWRTVQAHYGSQPLTGIGTTSTLIEQT